MIGIWKLKAKDADSPSSVYWNPHSQRSQWYNFHYDNKNGCFTVKNQNHLEYRQPVFLSFFFFKWCSSPWPCTSRQMLLYRSVSSQPSMNEYECAHYPSSQPFPWQPVWQNYYLFSHVSSSADDSCLTSLSPLRFISYLVIKSIVFCGSFLTCSNQLRLLHYIFEMADGKPQRISAFRPQTNNNKKDLLLIHKSTLNKTK